MIGGRGISWRAWFVVCALTGGGCDFAFRLDHVDFQDARGDTGDSRPGDGPFDVPKGVIDGAIACANPELYEPFEGDAACSPWATNVYDSPPSSQASEANGVLTIALMPVGSVVAGCKSDNIYALGSGVTAIVPEVTMGSSVYTSLAIHPANVQIALQGTRLHFQNTAGTTDYGTPVTYTTSMRWWRIRNTGTALVGEVSPNGGVWSTIGIDPITVSGGIGVEIASGVTSGSLTGKTVFDDLMICP